MENLAPAASEPTPAVRTALKRDRKLDRLLAEAMDVAAGDDGWAHLGAVGSNLSRLASDFDSRTWGYSKLKELIEAHPDYNVRSRPTGAGKSPNAFVRHT